MDWRPTRRCLYSILYVSELASASWSVSELTGYRKFKWKTILDLYLIWEKLIYSCTQHEKWGLLNVRKEKRSHNLSAVSLFLLSHLVKPGLKSFVSWIHSPHHLQALFSLLFHNVSQQGLKLFIFIIPCCEHFKASYHNLQEIIKTTII